MNTVIKSKNVGLINNISSYIEKHMGEKIRIDDIAKSVHYSKYHLLRVFKKNTGINIYEYVYRRKLNEAAKLLKTSEMPIIEIALYSGYESQQAFTQAFKMIYKTPPQAFREKVEFYPVQLKYDFEGFENFNSDMKIEVLSDKDIGLWLELMEATIDGFPKYNKSEHENSMQGFIQSKEAIIIKKEDKAVAGLVFSKNSGHLHVLTVHPLFKNNRIINVLLEYVMKNCDSNELSITTFRNGDKADTGQRNSIKSLGFKESDLLTEYGYPTQQFIYRQTDNASHFPESCS